MADLRLFHGLQGVTNELLKMLKPVAAAPNDVRWSTISPV